MVYLIHFDTPFKGCQHYLGWVDDARGRLDRRMEKHLKGQGACLLRAVNLAGIKWQLVRTWPGESRVFERRLKNHKKARCHCPVCNPRLTAPHKYQLNYVSRDGEVVQEDIFFELRKGVPEVKKYLKAQNIIGSATIFSYHFGWTISYKPRAKAYGLPY